MAITRLTELRDYEVARGEPDIRGWAVFDRDGHHIGLVEDLTVDTEAERVHEAMIDLNGHDYMIPIAQVDLDLQRQTVRVPATLEELRRLPEAKGWHSRERQVIRATFYPDLADAPPLGELSKEDVVEIHRAHEHPGTPVSALEPEETALPGEDPALRDLDPRENRNR